jgi:hypothetical protein
MKVLLLPNPEHRGVAGLRFVADHNLHFSCLKKRRKDPIIILGSQTRFELDKTQMLVSHTLNLGRS